MDNKIYQQVTDRIVAMLEAGTAPWRKSWKDAGGQVISGGLVRPLRSTGQPYTGINVLNLWAAAELRGFAGRHWMTFKTAKELGGQVRKGAKAELAFYVGTHHVTEERNGEEQERDIKFLRCYCVFNVDEIDGLPERFYAGRVAKPAVVESGRMPAVDTFVAATGAAVHHGGNRAFFSPSRDFVQMPFLAQFDTPEAYYSTLLHELTHWSGHDDRLNRGFGLTKRFGDDNYAAEELVAELGAAYLCADLGVSPEPRPDHASYLASWLRVLKADNKAIFKAATLADAAARYLHKFQPAEAPTAAPEAAPEAPAAAPVAEAPAAAPEAPEAAPEAPAKPARKPRLGRLAKPKAEAPRPRPGARFSVAMDQPGPTAAYKYATAEAAELAARRLITGRGGEISIWIEPENAGRYAQCVATVLKDGLDRVWTEVGARPGELAYL